MLVTGISGGESVRAAVGDAPVAGFAWAPDNAGLIVSSSRDTSGKTGSSSFTRLEPGRDDQSVVANASNRNRVLFNG